METQMLELLRRRAWEQRQREHLIQTVVEIGLWTATVILVAVAVYILWR